MPLEARDLDAEPLVQLRRWLADAEAAGAPLPNAFALGTADANGVPSVRFVLLLGLDELGLRFFGNRASRKATDVAANPLAAAAFWWPTLDRQARAAGPVRPLPDDESRAYWDTRARASRLSAWASRQGEPISSRAELEARVERVMRRFAEAPVPLPAFWGGYLLEPTIVEFWESRRDRLHDRIEYRRRADGRWDVRRLQP
jgi:pyridoxamine 5'-phosphate oxidase